MHGRTYGGKLLNIARFCNTRGFRYGTDRKRLNHGAREYREMERAWSP
jgi:hypothetical protein